MQEKFTVKNVKCGGCVKTIEQGLGGLPGGESVTVTIEGGKVDVTGSGLDRAQIGAKLRELGYPEA